MYSEYLETGFEDGWKLVAACGDGTIFPSNAVRKLCSVCLDNGSNLYDVLRSYISLPFLTPRRRAYKDDDVYKLVLPFLRGSGVSNLSLINHFKESMQLTNGSARTFRYLQEFTIPFLMTSIYEHYLHGACDLLEFPIENTYSTSLDMDYWDISREEHFKLSRLANEISRMEPVDYLNGKYTCIEDMPANMGQTVSRLDEIFESEILDFQTYRLLASTTILGQEEKMSAIMDMKRRTGISLKETVCLSSTASDALPGEIVKQGGGLVIAFNGCPSTVFSSDVAVLSQDTTVISFLIDVFQNSGKEYVLDLAENWSRDAILSSPVSTYLKNAVLNSDSKTLPVVVKVNENTLLSMYNDEENPFNQFKT